MNHKPLKVFSDEQLNKLLDRSDLSWGLGDSKEEKPKETKDASSSGIKGVFAVLDVDEKKGDLGSVKDK